MRALSTKRTWTQKRPQRRFLIAGKRGKSSTVERDLHQKTKVFLERLSDLHSFSPEGQCDSDLFVVEGFLAAKLSGRDRFQSQDRSFFLKIKSFCAMDGFQMCVELIPICGQTSALLEVSPFFFFPTQNKARPF